MLDDEYLNRVGPVIVELHGIGHGTCRRGADRVLCDCAVAIDSVGRWSGSYDVLFLVSDQSGLVGYCYLPSHPMLRILLIARHGLHHGVQFQRSVEKLMCAIRRSICRIGQVCGRKKGLRMLILVIYAIFASRFYYSAQDTSIFMGMFRIAPAMSHPDLALNMYPLLFMVGGIALALEQCSEYLMIPDYLVYVRSHRGWSHFCRYCALLLFYCVLFTGVQLIIALMIVPGNRQEHLLTTAICASLTLAVLMLIINVGYLLNCRVMGYVAAAALYIALLSLDGARRWLISSWIGVIPCWAPVLTVLFLVLAMVNLIVFEHVEMY